MVSFWRPRVPAALPLVVLMVASPAIAAPGDAQPLAAHRAIYELKLDASGSAKAPSAARGRIAYDFAGSACDGWVTNFRQVTEVEPREGPTRVSDMRSATFEDGEGKRFDFKVQTRVDDRTNVDMSGEARKSPDGALSVALQQPVPYKGDLDKDVLFPTQHIFKILDAARAGQSTVEAKVFDGSDTGRKVYDTLTVVGHASTAPAADKAVQVAALAGMRHWPVSVSYFEEGKKGDQPDYILSFDLYENGISRALKLDYGDFALSGDISTLEVLPQAPCQK